MQQCLAHAHLAQASNSGAGHTVNTLWPASFDTQRLQRERCPLIAATYDRLHPWQGLLSIVLLVQIDPSCSIIRALSPADNNGAAVCSHHISSVRRIQKISTPKHDGHTYKQTQNEMQSRISCLALRRSAIILHAFLHSLYMCYQCLHRIQGNGDWFLLLVSPLYKTCTSDDHNRGPVQHFLKVICTWSKCSK